MTYINLLAIGVLLAMHTADCLVCYSCDSQNSAQCEWGITSFTYPTEDCSESSIIGQLIPSQCYKITATSKAGKKYVARGCIQGGSLGCKFIAKTIGWISSESSDDPDSLDNISCDTCDSDKCNSADKIAGFILIGLVSSAIALLL